MFLLLILAGLILMFAGGSWFAGATTVGLICLIMGGVWLAIQLIITASIAAKVGSYRKSFRDW